MDYQFIDITSYRGISSNAEHFYARIGSPDYAQENMITMLTCEPTTGQSFVNGKELRYYPTEQEAEEMWKKDNHSLPGDFPLALKRDQIEDMMEYGTIRFPSILAIIKKARELFPESVLCFSMHGSRKEFVKYIQSLEKEDRRTLEEIFDTIGLK